MIGIVFIWAFSLCVAVGPLMEQGGHMFYQTALVKQNLFFDSWDISYDTLKVFATKLLQFHPNMKNLTESEVQTVLTTSSWNVLAEFLTSRYKDNFELTSYYG